MAKRKPGYLNNMAALLKVTDAAANINEALPVVPLWIDLNSLWMFLWCLHVMLWLQVTYKAALRPWESFLLGIDSDSERTLTLSV